MRLKDLYSNDESKTACKCMVSKINTKDHAKIHQKNT